MRSRVIIPFLVLGSLGAFALSSFTAGKSPKPEAVTTATDTVSRWKAPAWADTLKSPFPYEPLTIQQGEELYNLYCASCHGETGYGDGAAGRALGATPANFHSNPVKSQSDGILFWKLSTGRGNMPAFKEAFGDEQRWQLVAYLRKLSNSN
ncbi:hypothetical protein GCM10028819_49550 [Spirosoma humi]